jgi:hypothetical protein
MTTPTAGEYRGMIHEGRVARFTARLFWMLPDPAHTWLGKITSGWRVVAWVTGTATGGVEILDYCWERWPDNEPIRRRKA